MLRIHRLRALLGAACALVVLPLLAFGGSPGGDGEGRGDGEAAVEPFEGLRLRSIGPAFMSGRISDIAVDPGDPSRWYVAAGSGGVWRTENRGTTWTPVFDDQGSYSIGCVTVDPGSGAVWVGTGENVSGRHVGFGDGVYRSLDRGATWERRGLEGSEHVGSIVVHPEDPDVLWVAAQGPLWAPGGQRGVYKSTDGGASWRQVLGAGPYTGANEVVLDPRDPDVLYASLHQRHRTVAALMDGGPESGIHRSDDGGETWTKLGGGLPVEHVGKVGLALCPFEPGVVYATIEEGQRKGGFWRSTDGGRSWEKRSDYLSGGTGPHYYQEIFASPHVPGRVYQMDVRLHVTDDGGRTWRTLGHDAKHSDNHALWCDPADGEHLVVGCDGGLYETWDHGATWRFTANLPVTQFYKVALDDAEPFYNVYGGTQDNNSQGGPSRTLNAHGITNADWFVTLFGDGHQSATEPGNPDVVYCEWQQGNLVRFDRSTGEIVYIQPQPREGEAQERFNWDAPILVSPHDPARLYFASQRVWRSDDRGDTWRPVSGDLSRGIDRFREPIMGRTWAEDAAWDTFAMSRFGTVTSLAESPVAEGVLWAGTDDGRVHRSADGGSSWRSLGEGLPLPEGFFVNDIKADRFDARTAYVVADDHKQGDLSPYVLRTTDGGATWTNIGAGLPPRHLCWRLVQDTVDRDLLFVGTEFGVFFTRDAGARWHRIGGGMPNIPVRDLAIHPREGDLVCATFGRGFYVLDDLTPLRGLTAEDLDREAVLFPVRDALWYVPRRPLGAAAPMGRASQGDAFFVAPNPPFGAVVTYHLGAELRSAREERRAAEEGAEGARFPELGTLDAEEREPAPAVLLTVRDSAGAVVRRLEGPADRGFHRVAWNLRRAPVEAWQRDAAEDEWSDGADEGALVAPGRYTVALALRRGGQVTPVGEPVAFEVRALGGGALPGADPVQVARFHAELEEVGRRVSAQRARLAELHERCVAMESVLRRTPAAEEELRAAVRELRVRVEELQRRLDGDPRLAERNEAGPVSVESRLFHADLGVKYSTYGPTPAHRASLALARDGAAEVAAEVARIRAEDLPRLDAALEEAGAPWSPGR